MITSAGRHTTRFLRLELALEHQKSRRGVRSVRCGLCICDDCPAEDSAVFEIANRLIDLLEPVSPGDQLI